MNTGTPGTGFPWIFFALVFILAVPFWIIEAVTRQIIPFVNLPISALALLSPIATALILVFRENGLNGIKQLLKRPFDFNRINRKAWYLPVFLLMPAVIFLDYGILKLASIQVPDLQFSLLELPVYFVIFFISAICEEVGWTGYAIDRLQSYWRNALLAGMFLGVVWALWHIIPWLPGHGPAWIAGQAANTVLKRVLIVWLYNNTGKSLFAAVSFHTMANISELVLFPVYGSHYNPVITFFIMAIVNIAVVFLWGSRTLARYRFREVPGR
ncbi:MAG: CPBP family intramembrane metalloprotease [Dehalococcoidales bacterium]|nr:CPBP family intramembrane metalloprotease [Dehalococcoidales bacterium]